MSENPKEYPTPLLATKIMAAFDSNPDMYGVTTLTGAVQDNGKCTAECRLVKQPTTAALWEKHLKGEGSIGQVPIKPNNCVKWAAIDVDLYKGRLSFTDFLKAIREHSLPFIICRSKSGGAHIMVFFKEDAASVDVIQKLNEWAPYFGQGGSEIFPKQQAITGASSDIRYGSWLNMPYDGPLSMRYALKDDGESRYTPSEFVDLVEKRRIAPEDFKNLFPPLDYKEPFPDGPPCLNHIFTKELDMATGGNSALLNLATYLKKKNPQTWENEINAWNSKLKNPNDQKRLESTVLKSQKKTDYHYQCGKPDLYPYCNRAECIKREFGANSGDLNPDNKSMIQLFSSPVLFYLTIEGKQVELTSEQLMNPILFCRRVLEVCSVIHCPKKMPEWLDTVDRWMKSCTKVYIPPEMTPLGIFKELLAHWKKSATDDKDGLAKGNPFIDDIGRLVFRSRDLKEYLGQERFNELKPNEINGALRMDLKATETRITVGESNFRCWSIPTDSLEEAPDATLKPLNDENF